MTPKNFIFNPLGVIYPGSPTTDLGHIPLDIYIYIYIYECTYDRTYIYNFNYIGSEVLTAVVKIGRAHV
jgi:hypothetical protein